MKLGVTRAKKWGGETENTTCIRKNDLTPPSYFHGTKCHGEGLAQLGHWWFFVLCTTVPE